MSELDDLIKEQRESWEKLRKEHEEHSAKFQLEFEQKMEKFDRDLEAARSIGRDTMAKIVLLSTTIVGFSATLLSIEQLNLQVNTQGLKGSWLLFALAISLGLLIPYLESRAKYVIYWRSIQHQNWDRKLDFWEKLKIMFTIMYSVLIAPRNIIYCKIYDDEAVRKKNTHRNAQVIHWTNKVIDFLLFAELLFILTFIAALNVLLFSVVM